MFRRLPFVFIFSFLFGVVGIAACACGQEEEPAPRLFDNMGKYERSITTRSQEAQLWFNQGIKLLYGFNHDEAIRSFHQAAEADSACAIPWWGIAYAHGININDPEMTEERSRAAFDAVQEALRRIDGASEVEQALIRAVAERYAWPPPEDRRPLDEAYAEAMLKAWKRFPEDSDVGALAAEALMNLQPWDLWTGDGQPKGRCEEIVALLENVLQLDPEHPGANHFYIHAVEGSPTPEKALASADRLMTLVPGSGHLVHMPAHIYVRTGRYADAARSNELAIEADRAYFAVAPKPRIYLVYYVHNLHFLAYASMMEGRMETALNAAQAIEQEVPDEFLKEYVKLADGSTAIRPHVLVRFGRWQEILELPEPDEYRLLSRAVRHYARGVALAALSRIDEARQELAALNELSEQITDDWMIQGNAAVNVLPIARLMMEGEIAYRDGQRERAFEFLREAIELEGQLAYDEPPGWMQPVRHALGALLMGDGRAAEADEVYREDLRQHPNNGWSLLGLYQSLESQGRASEAAEVRRQWQTAWTRADVQPTSSCYCQPAGE